MAAFPFDIVAFDLDGTLADTAPDIAAALNLALADLGRPALAPDHIRTLIGDGARSLSARRWPRPAKRKTRSSTKPSRSISIIMPPISAAARCALPASSRRWTISPGAM
jgi:beta-phosphoglucomutase-like phosphatase (HAD superfamily)